MLSEDFKAITKELGFAVAVCSLTYELSNDFWESLSLEQLAAILKQSEKDSLAREKSSELLLRRGSNIDTIEGWLYINSLIKSRFKIKEDIAREICSFDLSFEEFHKLYKDIGCKRASFLGSMILCRIARLAKNADQLIIYYQLRRYKRCAPHSIVLKIAEVATNLEHWVFVWNHSGMDDEISKEAMQHIIEMTETFDDWLLVYKKVKYSGVRKAVREKIIELAGYDLIRWQKIIDVVSPKDSLGKLARQQVLTVTTP